MASTICVDFDGVIHRYSEGWKDGSIYDEPVPGALTSLHDLMKTHAVVIHTTRKPWTVVPWLEVHGIPAVRLSKLEEEMEFWDCQGAVLVSQKKFPAIAYIDDRAIRFENWTQALADLNKYTT